MLLFLFCSLLSAQTFNSDRAFAYLEAQCALGTREPNSAGHRAAKDYYQAFLKKQKGRFWRVDFTAPPGEGKSPYALTNFHILFGADKKAPRILLCAHWDTRPWADRDPDPAQRHLPIAGANDGASGVAVLLELCNMLSARPPERPIEIVLFDGEDYGGRGNDLWCQGSKHFAKTADASKYAFAVLLDMIGDRDLVIKQERHSLASAPQLMDRIWAIAARLDAGAFQKTPGPAVYDDHVPLIHQGIPAVDLIDFDYPYWHTMADTPDKCARASLDQVGRVISALIYEKR